MCGRAGVGAVLRLLGCFQTVPSHRHTHSSGFADSAGVCRQREHKLDEEELKLRERFTNNLWFYFIFLAFAL